MFSLLLIYTLDIIAIKVGFFTEQIILADADSATDIFDSQQEGEDAADGQEGHNDVLFGDPAAAIGIPPVPIVTHLDSV